MMKNKKMSRGIVCCLCLVAGLSAAQTLKFPMIRGDYFGQGLPGQTASIFAPGLLSTGLAERDVVFNPDGNELFYGLTFGGTVTFLTSRRLPDGTWTEPEIPVFARDLDHAYFEPCYSPDGNTLYFLTTRPTEGERDLPGWGNQNIFAVDRQADGRWGEAYDLGPAINTADGEFFPSMTKGGVLYFTRSKPGTRDTEIYRSRKVDGQWTVAERLPDVVNGNHRAYNSYIHPDETYLLACVGGEAAAQGQYMVFFRSEDDVWSPAISLGEAVNLPGTRAISQSLSPDGRYLFFASEDKDALPEGQRINYSQILDNQSRPRNGASDIYWIDAAFIESLRPVEK